MRRNGAVRIVALAGLAWMSAAVGGPVAAQGSEALVMVVNKSNGVEKVTKADAKRIMLGQMTTWPNGAVVTVAVKPQKSADHIAVLEKLCGMSEAEYTRYELQVMFTGRPATKVQEEPSAAAVKSFVKANPGAVGFLHLAEADADVKAVLALD
jgi:ABC-type phosphate transport system substrate-binding protein